VIYVARIRLSRFRDPLGVKSSIFVFFTLLKLGDIWGKSCDLGCFVSCGFTGLAVFFVFFTYIFPKQCFLPSKTGLKS